MYVNNLKSAFAKGLNTTLEAEVSFNCTQKKFNSIISKLQASKTPVARATTLDIGYNISTAKENSSYRLTYSDSKDIERIISEFNKAKAG